MCGIAGILPDRPADPVLLGQWVRHMTDRIIHRGPDDEGFLILPDVALGMRRLAIIDVAHGQQPMHGTDGRYSIVFNGEIYNFRTVKKELEGRSHRFTTTCDTEVVLAVFEAWGLEGLKRLEGMFSVAIWDNRDKRLTLARDWTGQKSLYWTRCQFGIAFASEIKALLDLPGVERKPDLAAMSHYMSLRYLPADKTFFAGVSKLSAAHAMTIHAGRVEFARLWTPAYEPKWQQSESELLDELDGIMKTVVGEHLMSEVPLGTFLSGGIDSSLVTAYAARASSSQLSTFSIGVDESSQSELPWARQVAATYKTRHTEKIVDPDLATLGAKMAFAMEEPVDPLAAGVYVVSGVARQQVTVALGGDGGDELFAGYDRYKGQELAEIYSHIPKVLRHGVLRRLIKAVPDSFGYNTFASKLRWLDQIADHSGFERYAESAAILRFPHGRKASLFTEETWQVIGTSRSENLLEEYFSDGAATAFIDRMLHTDCMTRLADHQLVIADKMSMAHSLELRNPFLDRRVAAFAARIPAPLKLKKRRLKYFIRKLGERYLPHDLLYRRKQGFSFPIAIWLRNELRPLLQHVINESRLVEAGIFRREAMQALAEEHWEGKADHNYRLWMLFNLEVFWRLYFDRLSIADVEDWIRSARKSEAVRA